MNKKFRLGNLKGRGHAIDQGVEEISKGILKNCNARLWTGYGWLRTGSIGELG
jgi:hypothetical protein